MYVLVPRRYNTPKWQAPVVPADHAFVFSDGTKILNLFELKNALTSLSDEVIYHHVTKSSNDIANWVREIVDDVDLADQLKDQSHRWGMLVALERQLMRTLNLPPYVATRWLKPSNHPFVFVSGEQAASLTELGHALESVTDDTVLFHLERFPNDMAQWVIDNIGDYELAEILNDCSSRLQMASVVADHISMLHDATEC